MHVTIVGGSGFIGGYLQKSLGGILFLNLDKNSSKVFPENYRKCDIRNKKELLDVMQPSDCIILLAAEHQDNVTPTSLYYDVNVEGTKNILQVADEKGIKKIIFTSSVAVYGLNKGNPDEKYLTDPFNHYGKSKWQAEELLREWYNYDPQNRQLIIIRPTVVFGPGNRGNVYNLLKQISSGKFMMVGNGENKKSLAFVENIAGFIKYCIDQDFDGYHLFNYSDKPDLSTRELVAQAELSLGKKLPSIRIPYLIGYTGGLFFDLIAKISGKKFPISAVRVKKFCATTQFSAQKIVETTAYVPKYSLNDALDITIKSIIQDGF